MTTTTGVTLGCGTCHGQIVEHGSEVQRRIIVGVATAILEASSANAGQAGLVYWRRVARRD